MTRINVDALYHEFARRFGAGNHWWNHPDLEMREGYLKRAPRIVKEMQKLLELSIEQEQIASIKYRARTRRCR